jgi:uncharacterized protein (UPF0147 family)
MRKQSRLERIEKLEQNLSDKTRAQQVALAVTPAVPAGERPIRPITIDSNDVIMGFADIAQDARQPGGARVAAWNIIAEIFLLKAKSIKDIRNFHGWTTDELKDYAVDGIIPERFRLLLGPSGLLEETATLRGDKHGGRPI